MPRPVVQDGYVLHPATGPDRHGLRIEQVLLERQTPYQHLLVVRTEGFGRALYLDGAFQSCEGDEFLYHEALVHPALILHPQPRRVLILGGGEGATAREVLRHPGVVEVRMVDLDEAVVQACREHLPELAGGAFDDPRLQLTFCDARDEIARARDWDVLIHDLTDPVEGGASCPLFTEAFLRQCRAALSEAGVFVMQLGALKLDLDPPAAEALGALTTIFSHVRLIGIDVPSFGCDWLFALASTAPLDCDGTAAALERRLAQRDLRNLRLIDGSTLTGLLHPPRHVRRLLEQAAGGSRGAA